MNRIELQASIRQTTGKGVAHRLRAQKKIPAVLYGRHLEKPLNIAVDPDALKKAINTPRRLNTLLTIKLDDGSERTVLLKDYQTDVIRHDLLHADFLDVRMDEKVAVKVPITFVGTPVGVTEGGILQTLRRELEITALPEAIPASIEIDVSGMKIGASLHVKDVKPPEGIDLRYLVNFTIAAVVAPETEAGAAAAAEAGAGAAAAGAPAAGASAAAAATKKK
jgi:large subunit ribosomal protein L25